MNDRQVLITRIFEAPRERVFRAWTDPDDVAEWYGPEHFDTPRDRIRIDLDAGGRYELTMARSTRSATRSSRSSSRSCSCCARTRCRSSACPNR